MSIRFKAGWVGGEGFKDWVASVKSDAAIAVTAGVSAAADNLKNELRDQITSAGMGTRLGNALGSNVYPRAGKFSLDAAGYVFPRGKRAESIFTSFNEAATVHAQGHRYLAIPTKDAGRANRFGAVTPEEFQFRTGIKLQVAKLPSGKLALVGESIGARSGHGQRAPTKRRRAQGRSVQTLIFFFLVPVAHEPRRLDFASAAAKWADRIPDLIDAATPQGDV